ncbi:MAG TPA: pitrilysin family protein [Micromonosporaceae bacterium]
MTVVAGAPRQLPALEANRELTLPASQERTLGNGLTVLAIERRSVPLVEVRLRVPMGRDQIDRPFVAAAALLSQTLFSGTADKSTVDIAAALQSVGGALSAGVDPDRLLVSGNGLASGLDRVFAILAEVLTGATYPEQEVATERARLIDRLQVAQSQPAHLAREALLRRMYGQHPYSVQTPAEADLTGLGPAELAAMHAACLHPAGATLVVVGALDPQQTLDLAEAAFGSWDGGGAGGLTPPVPPLGAGPVLLADRPGAVQSSMRLALPAVTRTHPDHAALQLANLVFGGYFSSRWVENIREDKGYTYSPHSVVEHSLAGSAVILSADVRTDVTAAALLETRYELGRIATSVPSQEELEQARQYALGSLLLGMSTQAGLAGLASTYAGFGLRLDFLAEHSARLAAATRDEVAAAAAKYLAPANAVTVILGDADQVEPSLTTLGPVGRATVVEAAGVDIPTEPVEYLSA